MGIGGVPSMPGISSSSSQQKLIIAEQQLQRAYGNVEGLLSKNPKLAAKLQQSLDLIRVNFSRIIEIKYHKTADQVISGVTGGLSQGEIDAITAQIATVTSNIQTLTAEIDALPGQLTQAQSDLAAAQATALSYTNALNSPSQTGVYFPSGPPLSSHYSNAIITLTNIPSVDAFMTSIDPTLTPLFHAMVLDPLLNMINVSDFGHKKDGTPVTIGDVDTIISSLATFQGYVQQNYSTDVYNSVSPFLFTMIDQLVQSRVEMVNSMTFALNTLNDVTIPNLNTTITHIQARIVDAPVELSAAQAQLAALNQQLADGTNTAGIAFFNSLTPLEKLLFRALYPTVTFPS